MTISTRLTRISGFGLPKPFMTVFQQEGEIIARKLGFEAKKEDPPKFVVQIGNDEGVTREARKIARIFDSHSVFIGAINKNPNGIFYGKIVHPEFISDSYCLLGSLSKTSVILGHNVFEERAVTTPEKIRDVFLHHGMRNQPFSQLMGGVTTVPIKAIKGKYGPVKILDVDSKEAFETLKKEFTFSIKISDSEYPKLEELMSMTTVTDCS